MFAVLRAPVVLGLLIAIVFLIAPLYAFAADLLVAPATGTFEVGEEFDVRIAVAPDGESVNAADGVVNFDPTAVSVTNISKEGSAFSLWTEEPAYSNSAGSITFSGGTPTPFSTERTIITVTFKASKEGSTKTTFSEGTVLAADGLGTDVYENGREGNFTISAAAPSAPAPSKSAPVAPSQVSGVTPEAPVIKSSTHPEPDDWYATTTANFSWDLPVDVTAVRLLLSDKEDATPQVVNDPPIASRTLTDIEDGVWYFYAQYRNDFGWGDTAVRKIQIDTVPPLEFSIALIDEEGSVPTLSFTAEDELSGMDRYEVLFGSTIVSTVRAAEAEKGFPVPPQEGGPQLVTIKAYDNAGNVRESSEELTLPAVARPSSRSSVEEEEEKESFITFERVLLLMFVFATGGLVAWNMRSQNLARAEKERHLQLVLAVREKNDKVFSAMREEFEQMVNDFDVRPQLTPAERDLIEGIKEVLDISEGLVDSDLEDLKRSIRGT